MINRDRNSNLYIDIFMHYNCIWHTKSIYKMYSSKFQVNMVTNTEAIRQNVISHTRVMVTGVSSDRLRTRYEEYQLVI